MKKRDFFILFAALLAPYFALSQLEFNKREIRREVRNILKEFSDKDVFHIPLNENGWKTDQYNSFLKLEKIATEKEFMVLTSHSNPVVQCYSFYALLHNHFETESWKVILEKNSCNFTKVKKRSGCIIQTLRVNQVMFELTSQRTGIPELEIMKRMGYPKKCNLNE